ncbi:hypothetical protein AXG93_3954s1120 [Marchantia polymorpha subsp. ruderalis]|uniref:Integrase catalytic domain-containing protein n=1 Tax=Marchantia polymorpha subsp. ruderalis TaxID=1480154 RepID=A0A176VM72_MARPO|nr:hypothetical protein AXG93_3954s1120 [Marchantia polymorpha subsp. ruderalis]
MLMRSLGYFGVKRTYSLHLDFAKPLPLTVRHHRYVLVMVKHFSKWIELVALPDKASEEVAYAFLDSVLSHFGALAKFQTCGSECVLNVQRSFGEIMPAAFENLAIAQHRDTLRYATIRGGGYRPSIRRFCAGDYVYLQHTASTTLDVTVGRTILRVQEVLPSGVLMLEVVTVWTLLFLMYVCVSV